MPHGDGNTCTDSDKLDRLRILYYANGNSSLKFTRQLRFSIGFLTYAQFKRRLVASPSFAREW